MLHHTGLSSGISLCRPTAHSGVLGLTRGPAADTADETTLALEAAAATGFEAEDVAVVVSVGLDSDTALLPGTAVVGCFGVGLTATSSNRAGIWVRGPAS